MMSGGEYTIPHCNSFTVAHSGHDHLSIGSLPVANDMEHRVVPFIDEERGASAISVSSEVAPHNRVGGVTSQDVGGASVKVIIYFAPCIMCMSVIKAIPVTMAIQ